jgi:hypothetical protein
VFWHHADYFDIHCDRMFLLPEKFDDPMPSGPQAQTSDDSASTKVNPQPTPKSELSEIPLPSDLRHLLVQGGTHLAGAVLTIAGAAIGRGAILTCELFPRPVNAALAFALCFEQPITPRILDDLVEPLRDAQDRKLEKFKEGNASVQEQIEQIFAEQENHFAGHVLRDPQQEANFAARIARLKGSRYTTLIAENPRPCLLEASLVKNGGGGLLTIDSPAAFHRELAAIKKASKNLEIVTDSLQGKTPQLSSKSAASDAIVRPVIGFLGLVFPNDIAALQASPEPVAEDFSKDLLLARVEKPIQQQFGTLPAFWKIKVNRLLELRNALGPRNLRLSTAAAATLKEYLKEIEESQKHGFINRLLKLSLILHLWKECRSDEISTTTMAGAIGLARELARQKAAAVEYSALGNEEKQLRAEAAILLQKLKKCKTPPTRRELYRYYDDERRELHDPHLDFLLTSGEVHWVEGNRLAPRDGFAKAS